MGKIIFLLLLLLFLAGCVTQADIKRVSKLAVAEAKVEIYEESNEVITRVAWSFLGFTEETKEVSENIGEQASQELVGIAEKKLPGKIEVDIEKEKENKKKKFWGSIAQIGGWLFTLLIAFLGDRKIV